MKQYTIADWENGLFEKYDSASVEDTYEKGLIPERIIKEIRRKQEWTYDTALELFLEKEKQKWLKDVGNSKDEDLLDIIKEDIEIYNMKLQNPISEYDYDYLKLGTFDNNKERINYIKKGVKAFIDIEGKEYLKVKEEYEKYKNKEPFTDIFFPFNINFYLASIFHFIKFLKEKKEDVQPAITEKQKEVKEIFLKCFKDTEVFQNESDFNTIVKTLTLYFVNNMCIPPEKIIKTKADTLTKLKSALANVQRHFKTDGKPCKYDYDFAKIIKQIDKLQNEEENALLEKLTKMEKN